MNISTVQLYQQAVNSMLNTQAELAKTQQQIATGSRILTPSDDPAAATRIIDLNKVIETTQQFQRNADFAETRLAMSESVLTEVGDILQRVREISVHANNGSLSASDRLSLVAEVRLSIDGLMQLANTTDANGEYLFAGFKTGTVPFTDDGSGNFTYNGDHGERSLQIGARRQVSVGDTGNDVFMKIDDGAGGKASMFSVVYDFVADLEANTPTGDTLTRLDFALNVVNDTRAGIGGRLNTIDGQRNVNSGFNLILQENRTELQDLDYAEAISRFEQQLLSLQASQQSFVKIQGLSLFNYL